MAKRRVNPELIDDDNPEWTEEMFARARPGAEVLGADFIKRIRGPQKAPRKQSITIRLSPDVLARFRDSGSGWQGRIDSALRDWLKRHSPRT